MSLINPQKTIAKLTEADFITQGINREDGDEIIRPSVSYWADVWRRMRKNKPCMISLGFIALMGVGVLIVPLFSASFTATNLAMSNQGPSGAHWFGTDQLGRDLWARVWVGGRVSVAVGFGGAILPSLGGIVIGGISGYFGGKLDMVITRIIDIMICIPAMIYIILLMLVLGGGPLSIILALAISGWTGFARGTRVLVMRLKTQEYVLASRALGGKPMRLIFRHMFPNFFGIILVGITMFIPSVIFMEAFLSFMGLGVQPPTTSWGQLTQMGTAVFRSFPYQLIFPATFISLYMLAFNLFGDGFRDALDPRLRDK
jgi:oligopeptide transport system permease protein